MTVLAIILIVAGLVAALIAKGQRQLGHIRQQMAHMYGEETETREGHDL
jgi:hypothetical protein